jgi:hypothetical protein
VEAATVGTCSGLPCRKSGHVSFSSNANLVELPDSVDVDKTEATYENGVLTLTIPKAEEVKPKTIKVEAAKK